MDRTVEQAISTLVGWSYDNQMLRKTFEFKDFAAALAWTVHVGFVAESHAHHPDIDIRYNRVTLALVTHDMGNQVTHKDIDLARAIDGIMH